MLEITDVHLHNQQTTLVSNQTNVSSLPDDVGLSGLSPVTLIENVKCKE